MTGFNSKRAMAIGRQTGTSDFNKTMQKFYDMQPPTKIIWHQLPGHKLKASWLPTVRKFELGLKESDMDPIQKCVRIATAANVLVLIRFNLPAINK